MSKHIWGATRAEWEAFARLALADVRPCVMNPHLMTAPTKNNPVSVKAGDSFTKRPSRLYGDNLVGGIRGWQVMNATPEDIQSWTNTPDLGIGLVGRTIKAIDLDIDDEDLAEEVDAAIAEYMGGFLPARRRAGSPRRVLLFRLSEEDSGRSKVVISPSQGGQIEFLFDRSFFVVAGTHKSGQRQGFPDGLPTLDDIPAISIEKLEGLIDFLIEEFHASSVLESGETFDEFASRDITQVNEEHPATQYVMNHSCFRQVLSNGMIAVECPWKESHSETKEENPSATVFLPVGLGGNDKFPGFKCMHVSHGPKTGAEFLDAIGYGADEFEVVESITTAQATRPDFIRMTKNGLIPANEVNMELALQWFDRTGLEIVFDPFKGDVMVREVETRHWRPFTDEDYFVISHALISIGFMSIPDQKLRSAVASVAKRNVKDSAIDWLNTLHWDGVDRFENFHIDVLGTANHEYPKAVVKYIFTAMAGRVLTPGVKSDMVPVFVGRQGVRKSTFVHALSPFEDWSVDIDMSDRDADTTRMLRGKVVAELAELRGLGTKDEDSIKAWISRTHDEWIPKFKEFTNRHPRRFLMMGTTNVKRFLADSTGHRRWLPVTVCEEGARHIDVDYVLRNRDQLWAQGKHLFKQNGIMWQEAERLAKHQHYKYERPNLLAEAIGNWIARHGTAEFTTFDIATGGAFVDVRGTGANRMTYQVERALYQLGFEERDDGKWHLPFL